MEITFIKILLMLVKPVIKIGKFLGLEWLLIFYCISTKVVLETSPFLELFIIFVYLILQISQIGLNLYFFFKGEKSRNALVFLIYSFIKRKKSKTKGFVSKLNTDSKLNISGMVFGKNKGKYVTKKEQEDGHALIIGGAGSGKSSGIAIPTLLSWEDKAFVIDIKGELYEKTKYRRGVENIKIFNPSDPTSLGYDPYYILENSIDLSSSAYEIAESIIPLPTDTKEPMWIKNARDMFTGFILFFYKLDFSFAETIKEIKLRDTKALIKTIVDSEDEEAKLYLSNFLNMGDKTLTSIFTEISTNITALATNKLLQNALNKRGEQAINPYDLENGYDVFICIEEHNLAQWNSLINLIINQFIKYFEMRPNDNTDPILFLLDEFPRLGKIETISNGLATLRSKKIEFMLYVQSKSQLDVNYGEKAAEVIADNCTFKAILKASEPKTQKWCSDLIGTYDESKKSKNNNADTFGINKGTGTSTTTEEKRIIKPEEFAYLQDVVCIFPNGYNRIKKIEYWKDSLFSKLNISERS